MGKILLKQTNSNLKPLGDDFYSLIKSFVSEDFVVTKENLLDFVTKLHNLDYQNQYEKMFTIRVNNSLIMEGGVDFESKQILMATNRLLDLDKDVSKDILLAYKVAFLNSYFHEARHEKQLDICNNLSTDGDAYNKVMTYELLNLAAVYNQFSSLIEVDARMVSIERIVDLMKRDILPKNPEVYTFVMDECVSMLDGINHNEFEMRPYQQDPFSCEKLLNKVRATYINDFAIFGFMSPSFCAEFRNEFSANMENFKEKILRYLMFNVVAKYNINSKIARYFSIDAEDENAYIKFFFDKVLTYSNEEFGCLIRIKSEQLRKEANEYIITPDEILEYMRTKNPNASEKDIVIFFRSQENIKGFEEYFRNKHKKKEVQEQKEEGYNALLNAIMQEEDEYER